MTNICPCGSVFLPKGSKFDFDGMSIRIVTDYSYVDLDLVHNSDSFLSNGQLFVTSSETILLNENIKQVILHFPTSCKIVNSINIVIKSFLTKEILFSKVIGQFGEETLAINNEIELHNSCSEVSSFNLYNDKLQLEIQSICDFFDEECCDTTPNSISLTNLVSGLSIECCGTTPVPDIMGVCCYRSIDPNTRATTIECLGEMTESECDPYIGLYSSKIWTPSGNCVQDCSGISICEAYNLPSSFSSVFIGGGIFDGQETELEFNLNNDTWSASGYLPCGNLVTISFYCDSGINRFVYDGSIDCCIESTKRIIEPQLTPIFMPNERPTVTVLWYDECIACNNLCIEEPPSCQSPEFIESAGEDLNDCCVTVYEEGAPFTYQLSDLTISQLESIGYDIYGDSNTCVPLIIPAYNFNDIYSGLGTASIPLISESGSNIDGSLLFARVYGSVGYSYDGFSISLAYGLPTTTTTLEPPEPLDYGYYEVQVAPEAVIPESISSGTIYLCEPYPVNGTVDIPNGGQWLYINDDCQTTTTTTPEPVIACIFYTDYDPNIHTIISGPYDINCSGTPPDPPPTTTTTTTTTTIIPTNPGPGGPGGPSGPGGGPGIPFPPNWPNNPNNPGGGGGGAGGGGAGGGGAGGGGGGGGDIGLGGGGLGWWPNGGNPIQPNPPCFNIFQLADTYPANVTEDDLIDAGFGDLVQKGKNFPNSSVIWASIWSACDKVAKSKCHKKFNQNKFVLLKDGTKISIDTLISMVTDDKTIGGINIIDIEPWLQLIVDNFPQMNDLKNVFIEYISTENPNSIYHKKELIIGALQQLKNCLESNCEKKLFLRIGRPIGGKCFKHFEYVQKPKLKEGCKSIGTCCLIDKEDCIPFITKLQCAELSKNENGIITEHYWVKSDEDLCNQEVGHRCFEDLLNTTTTTTTTSTTPEATSTTTAQLTLGDCDDCAWPSEYTNTTMEITREINYVDEPPNNIEGYGSWTYSQAIPENSRWIRSYVFQEIQDESIEWTYQRSRYHLICCLTDQSKIFDRSSIIDITDDYVEISQPDPNIACIGSDNILDQRSVSYIPTFPPSDPISQCATAWPYAEPSLPDISLVIDEGMCCEGDHGCNS